ncbi:MAG: hypothetical protein AAFU57_01545 [Bacteroidota bacterium]
MNKHILLAILTVFIISCSNSDDSEFEFALEGTIYSMTDIAGAWNAQLADFEELEVRDSGFEVIDLGGTFTMTVQENGRFFAVMTFPDEPIEEFSGQLGFDGVNLVMLEDGDGPGDEAYFNMEITTDGLWNLDGDILYDLDDDGVLENTMLRLRLERI